MKANSYLEDIVSYKPGKSKVPNGGAVIKLSSNENALGPSPKAIMTYKNYIDNLHRYHDGSCTKLRETIAKKHDINLEQITCGAGSDEIISLLAQAFCSKNDEIIYSKHGFLMYPISAKKVGAKAIKAEETGLKANISEIIKAITDKTRIIFIANPNNPTGSYLNNDEIKQLIELTPKNILIVLDHAYDEFVIAANYPKDALNLVSKFDNVVVTKTFSKIYGLASLRVGWCYSSLYIADILNKIRGPFNVSGPAQICAIASLEDDEFLQRSIEHNVKWLESYKKILSQNKNFKLYDSVGNFVLIDFFNRDNCVKANQMLQNSNIIARDVGAYGLDSCLRLSIGNDSENETVMEKLIDFEN